MPTDPAIIAEKLAARQRLGLTPEQYHAHLRELCRAARDAEARLVKRMLESDNLSNAAADALQAEYLRTAASYREAYDLAERHGATINRGRHANDTAIPSRELTPEKDPQFF